MCRTSILAFDWTIRHSAALQCGSDVMPKWFAFRWARNRARTAAIKRKARIVTENSPQITRAFMGKEVVRAFMSAFSSGDVEATFAYLSDSATWWVAGQIEGISGSSNRAEFREMLIRVSTMTKSGVIYLTPLAWTVEGDRVAVEASAYAEIPDGRSYQNMYHFVFVVHAGLIQSVKAYLDTEHVRDIFGSPRVG